jgi:L-arabinose isomerase
MIDLSRYQVWFVTGSQHLYGPEAIEQVAANAQRVVEGLNDAKGVGIRVVYKPVLTTPQSITEVCRAANCNDQCVGLIAWMHTFSPAKMWIGGLRELQKPLAHLHTQFNRDIPYSSIDMDFMNLNQSAHGGREFGYITTRMRRNRRVIVGHWEDEQVHAELDSWFRAACACADQTHLKIARLGDNMRNVAVTEGDKVAAEKQFGYSVNGWAMGDLAEYVKATTEKQVDELCREYDDRYGVTSELGPQGARRGSLRDAARIELGLRSFLEAGGFNAFTDTFENLHGLPQLPGIAVQRLMADGYGFGAEGDWKTAALVRAMKVMASGREGGTSFMEDYTYHLDTNQPAVLGAHMLEICPSIAADQPSCEVHPLSIGGKEDPVRLVFDAMPGKAVNASVIDMGGRFRMLVNPVNVVTPPEPLPRLPVARALWQPEPDLKIAAAAWIYAGGAHHTSFSQSLTVEDLENFADMADIELAVIDHQTSLRQFRQELRQNDLYYHLARGLG